MFPRDLSNMDLVGQQGQSQPMWVSCDDPNKGQWEVLSDREAAESVNQQ